MHTFLDNDQKGGKYSAQISSHQAKPRREEKIMDKNHCLYPLCKLIVWIWTIQCKIHREKSFHTQNAVIVEDLYQYKNALDNSIKKRVRNSTYVTTKINSMHVSIKN